MKWLIEFIKFLGFQTYLGSSMPSRELPQDQNGLTEEGRRRAWTNNLETVRNIKPEDSK